MKKKTELNEQELDKAVGGLGMSNPVSALSREEAEQIAAELGKGRNMGSWTTMSGDQFMKWWESSHPEEAKGKCGIAHE